MTVSARSITARTSGRFATSATASKAGRMRSSPSVKACPTRRPASASMSASSVSLSSPTIASSHRQRPPARARLLRHPLRIRHAATARKTPCRLTAALDMPHPGVRVGHLRHIEAQWEAGQDRLDSEPGSVRPGSDINRAITFRYGRSALWPPRAWGQGLLRRPDLCAARAALPVKPHKGVPLWLSLRWLTHQPGLRRVRGHRRRAAR